MPTQHGSDKILKDMKRGLGSDGIRKRIDALRNANNSISIRTSMIVGFPGETEKEFQELYDFVEEIKFDRLGVFQYSEEEGTHGAKVFDDNVPKAIKKERYEAIMMLQQKINYKKNINRIGSIEKILIDIVDDNEDWSLGRSYRDAPEIDNYVKINKKLETGKIYEVKIDEAYEYDVLGSLLNG